MTTKRIALLLLGLPVVLILAAAAWLVFLFDVDTLRPRLAAEAERATGRSVAIAGPLHIALWPRPSISGDGLSLANLPGGSRPEMLTIRHAEAEVAFWPLLEGRVALDRLRLVGADLVLENDNWVFVPIRAEAEAPSPPAPPAPAPSVPATPAPAREPMLSFSEVVLEEARIAEGSTIVTIPSMTLRDAEGRLTLEGQLQSLGVTVALSAEGGPASALLAGFPAPWPLKVTLSSEGVVADFDGTLAPAPSGAARLRLDRLARLAPLVAGLPNAEGMDAQMQLASGVIGPLRLTVGAFPIGPAHAEQLALTADGADAPISGTGQLHLGEGVLATRFSGGPLSRFLPGAKPADWPLRVDAEGEGLTLGASGFLPANGGLPSLEVALNAADLGAAGRRFGLPAPALHGVTLHVIGQPAADAVLLRPLSLGSAEGDFAGEATVTPGAVPHLVAQLASRRLDVAAMMLAAAQVSAGLSPPPATAPAGIAAVPLRPPPLPVRSDRLVPDLPLPLELLKDVPLTADVGWRAAEVLLEDQTYRDIDLHLRLEDGRMVLDPFGVTIPGGRVAMRIAADATAVPPSLALRLRSDRLEVAALADALGQTRRVSGPLEVDLDLTGPGTDLRGFVAGSNGHVGLAMVGGKLERAALAGLPPDLVAVLMPGGIPAEGVSLRCSAALLRAGAGAARIETLLVDGDLGRVGGSGAIGLADESLNLRLLPDLHLGQVNLRAPVTIIGTLSAPRLGQVDPAGAAAGAIGALLSLQRSPDRQLSDLAQSLSGNAPALPDCGPALAAARGGSQGAVPPPRPPAAAAPAAPATRRPVTPEDVLRGLFGR